LLQGCDLLHGIAIKSHSAKQVIQPESADFHTVLSFPQPKTVIWHLLSVAVNTLSQAFVALPVSQRRSHSSLWLPPLPLKRPSLIGLRWQLHKNHTLQICESYVLGFSGCIRCNSTYMSVLLRSSCTCFEPERMLLQAFFLMVSHYRSCQIVWWLKHGCRELYSEVFLLFRGTFSAFWIAYSEKVRNSGRIPASLTFEGHWNNLILQKRSKIGSR